MSSVIKISKGLDINLKGKAKEVISAHVISGYYSICPDDFPGFMPKVAVKAGDKVLAGTAILYDKNHPEVKIVSPVSGEITEINRGEKRKLLNILIAATEKQESLDFGKKITPELPADEIKNLLAEAGIFPFIKQRPYDIIANPQDTPRDIFVPGFYSAPLAPDLEFLLKGQEPYFQKGLDILSRLTPGKVYLGIDGNCRSECLIQAKNVEIVRFYGPHPAGNAGVQINHIKPVNKGEVVWTINPADVLFIGRLFLDGKTDFTRLVALTGSEVKDTGYYQAKIGTNIGSLVEDNVTEGITLRYISGNVLTGKQIPADGFLAPYDNQLTVIPEGVETDEFFGWALPGLKKFSNSKTFFTWLTDPFHKKEYIIDARIKGGKRAMIMSNEYNKVFPMDILPEFLLKAIIAFDIDKMENLGIYEVAPEDFALCEFVDTSKIEIQQIVRKGLNLLHKEMN